MIALNPYPPYLPCFCGAVPAYLDNHILAHLLQLKNIMLEYRHITPYEIGLDTTNCKLHVAAHEPQLL
jgi:hypothetical protein